MSTANLARNLDDILRFLDISPLRFEEDADEPMDEVIDGRLRYVPRPGIHRPAGKRPLRVMDKVKTRLLKGRADAKIFLSGHVGSGKSTELARLVADADVRDRFFVISFRFEEEEWAYLDSAQILFRVAAELFKTGLDNDLLKEESRWKKLLLQVDEKVGGPSGVSVSEGSLGAEWNLFFVKLKQELKLSDHRRRQFRSFGETDQTLIQDLIVALLDDLELGLAERGDGRSLLMVIDDLDKVRDKEGIEEIFERNVNALLQPPLRMLGTLPGSVAFSPRSSRLRDCTEHLRPVQVLSRTESGELEDAFDRRELDFFQAVLDRRVAKGLVGNGALDMAVLYSGGVLRDLFHLLREAALRAAFDGLDQVSAEVMEEAVQDARIKWSAGIYPEDRKALAAIRQSRELASPEQTRYLDISWVLECYNGELWYDVNPLLWKLLH